jgi:hypothetical protein
MKNMEHGLNEKHELLKVFKLMFTATINVHFVQVIVTHFFIVRNAQIR